MSTRERLRAKRRHPAAFAALHGKALALLCALALALIPGALLGGQSAQAAPHTTFYGIADSALLTSTSTATSTSSATSTSTSTPTGASTSTPTATNTPAPTATDTPTPAPTATNTPTPAPTATPSGPPPNNLDVSVAATEAQWPQQGNNWCGIATVALIADYLNPGANLRQQDVANVVSSSASTSEWGAPAPDYTTAWGPGVTADISRDFGTDPRSLAYALTAVTGTQYHAIVDTNGAWDTTINIVHDILTYRQPISVFVDHGQHSVIVSGVDATGNPLTNPGSITAIHVWDPGDGQPQEAIQPQTPMAVPISQWLSGIIPWSGSDYFKYPYSANIINGHALDPDPAVGPYTYVPSLYNHLWVGHYVYISPIGYVDPAGTPQNVTSTSYVSDWEFTPAHNLIAGEASSGWPPMPAGYSGGVVPMPTNPPPPPPPVQVFKTKPLPKPKPKPVPKPTPVPTATPPRARPSPTPASTTSTEPILPDTAAVPARCASISCALATMPPLWALYTFGGLLLMALLLSIVLFATRQRARPGFAAAAIAGAEAPLLPPVLNDALEPGMGDALEESASTPAVDPAATAATDSGDSGEAGASETGPAIVPVLDADTPGVDASGVGAESGETEA